MASYGYRIIPLQCSTSINTQSCLPALFHVKKGCEHARERELPRQYLQSSNNEISTKVVNPNSIPSPLATHYTEVVNPNSIGASI